MDLHFTMPAPDEAAMRAARAQWDAVAHPLNSLGELERAIVRIAGVQRTRDVHLAPACALVFCGDHGVVRQGVSQSGQEVTAAVARAIVGGTSNINLMAKPLGVRVVGVDMGMAIPVPGLVDCRLGAGTMDMTENSAMTLEQAERGLLAGMEQVRHLAQEGARILTVGEMGIGNTTAGTALIAALTGKAVAPGRGAGLTDAGLSRKAQAIERALRRHRAAVEAGPVQTLAALGGFEIAGMAGAFLGGAAYGVPMVIDGMISAAAALTAVRICPEARYAMFASHLSREPAAMAALGALALRPVIDADLALGEGTGALMLLPLLTMACAVYAGTHTFGALGMAPYCALGGEG